MNNYDHEKTTIAIQQSGANHLDPMTMIHEDLKACFRIVGKNKDQQDDEAKEQAAMKNEVANLKEQLGKLQNRLWGLLILFITEIVGVLAAWLCG